jgi:putative membrane protein
MKLLWIAAEVVGQSQPGYPEAWGWHYGMMGTGWGIFMIILMLLFWGLVIGGIVLLVRLLFPTSRSNVPEDPLEILKRRYARGEIQKAEFEEKKKDLTS